MVMQGSPLLSGAADVPAFDQQALTVRCVLIKQARAPFPSFSPLLGVQASFVMEWT